jgi:hypothetical protein
VNENASIAETSITPIMEELMKKLEKLNVELTKLKTKNKKDKKNATASEDDDSSHEEDVSNKAISFNYNSMPNSTAYTSVPVGKAPYFDRINYNQWKHCMKSYLYSISPEV